MEQKWMALPLMQTEDIVQAVLFFTLLLAASVWDIRKRIIPDELNILILCAGLPTFSFQKLLGILLSLPLLIAALNQEGSIGGGDIKLTVSCGFVLGLSAGCAGLIMGLSAAVLYHLIIQSIRKLKHMNAPAAGEALLPLAPFLSAGFIASYLINFGGLTL